MTKGGSKKYPAAPAAERFKRHYFVAENGCWIWTGELNTQGYGRFNAAQGDKWRAHRWSYTHKYGPIPEGLVLDHYVCSNPSCVNPDHVRPVTHQENSLRSHTSGAATNAAKTHCVRGHELPPYMGVQRPRCRECSSNRRLLRTPPPHGTPLRYASDGCRCDECRAANAAYKRDLRNRRREASHG